MQRNYQLLSEQATLDSGKALAACLQAGDKVYLQGNLGAGKTTLARGILRGFDYQGKVKSPSYTLVESYTLNNGLNLFHFDLYRMAAPDELLAMGFDDYLNEDVVLLIEWPEKAENLLPKPSLLCKLTVSAEGRSLDLLADSVRGQEILAGLSGEF